MEDRSVFDLEASDTPSSVAYGGHPDHVMDAYGEHRPSDYPVALLHGGYWRPEIDRTYLRPLAARLAHHVTVYNIEYRRVPGIRPGSSTMCAPPWLTSEPWATRRSSWGTAPEVTWHSSPRSTDRS